MSEIEEIKAKARDEGYQTGKSDSIKECKMLVGTYGVKDIDSEETKIYIRAREEAVECLSKYEPHIGDWSWHGAYKEIQSLNERIRVKDEALEELVTLKNMKDLNGDSPDYRERKPLAWEAARKALNGGE